MSEESKAQFIQPPNTLKTKVVEGGPGAVNLAVLAKAEDVIAGMADAYEKWAAEDLDRLAKAVAELAANLDDPAAYKEKLFQVAHDMKGQGGSFGYDLMTVIGDGLCRFLEKREDYGPRELEAIQLHVAAMHVVMSKQMKGDGGPDGIKLLKGLEMVSTKLG